MKIYCCGCERQVEARLTNGAEIYPSRGLDNNPFWKCDECKNYVGCHYKSGKPTNPLGCIPTKEIRATRMKIHKLIDPLWRDGSMSRSAVYSAISNEIGHPFHVGEIHSVRYADKICSIINRLFFEDSYGADEGDGYSWHDAG